MKLSNLSKVIGASALGLSLAVLPAHLSASAQTTGGTGAAGTTTVAPAAGGTLPNVGYHDGGNGGYWGLLGLLGLFGLFGRAGSKSATAYRDPNEVGTGARY